MRALDGLWRLGYAVAQTTAPLSAVRSWRRAAAPTVYERRFYDSEELAEVMKTMGNWKLGAEANTAAARNEDDVEGHAASLKNDAAAAADAAADDVEGHGIAAKNAEDDVEGHWGAKNVDDQGAETDESSDKPGVRVRVRVRNDDDTEGHAANTRNADDDVEGHAATRNSDDDVEGHNLVR